MKNYDDVPVNEIETRLAQFLKPSHMPVSARMLSEWVEEAEANDGQVTAEANWTISGHHERFTL